jgi:hypothetical protein
MRLMPIISFIPSRFVLSEMGGVRIVDLCCNAWVVQKFTCQESKQVEVTL